MSVAGKMNVMVHSTLILWGVLAAVPIQEPQPAAIRQLVVELSVKPVNLAERSRTFRCELRLDRGDVTLTLGEVDVEGSASSLLRWAVPEGWFIHPKTVCRARLTTPGFQQREAGARIVRSYDLHDRNGTEEQPIEFQLAARRGSTWSGRVLPASKALVGGRVELAWPGDGSREVVASESLYRSGKYTLHLEDTGTFELAARVPGVGTASPVVVHVEEGVSGVLPDLHLHGPGEIRGRVTELNGGALSGRKIFTLHDSIPVVEPRFVPGWPRPGDGESGQGCRRGSSALAEDGGFRITGLEPGRYRLFVSSNEWSNQWLEVSPSPLATGSEDQAVSIATPMVDLRLVDADGEAVEIPLRGLDPFGGWGKEWVRLQEVSPEGRVIYHNLWPAPPALPRAGDRYLWQVVPGEQYVVQVYSPDRGLIEEYIDAPGDGSSLLHTLIVPAPVGPEEFPLEVTFPESPPRGHDWSIEVSSASTGSFILALGKYSDRDKLILGPGRYSLRVDCDPFPAGCWQTAMLMPPDPAPCAPIEVELTVLTGDSRPLTIEFAEGGRLRLEATIEGDPSPEVADLLDWFEEPIPRFRDREPFYSISDELDLLFDTGTHPGGGRLEWLDDPTAPKRLDFFWPGNEVVSRWGHFIPGRSNLLRDPLPPGRHRLRLTVPGCVPIEREVEIRANEVVELRAQFRRQ